MAKYLKRVETAMVCRRYIRKASWMGNARKDDPSSPSDSLDTPKIIHRYS